MTASPSNGRLPKIASPKHYELKYHTIDFVNFTFDGSVSIEFSALSSSRSILLHSIELQLTKATILRAKKEGQKQAQAIEFRYRPGDQTCEIIFEEKDAIQKGEDAVLVIDFMGVLNNQMHGLYRSSYEGLDGKQHIMATTQFEATDARRAFPCFDEPALKATFSLVLTIPAHLQCLSNTPMKSTQTFIKGDALYKTVAFQQTPKMSTYLLALVVGQFDGISKTSNGVVTTVYTVPGKASQGYFCLDTATRCLDLYVDLFKIKYPLTKSDLIAIPDFAAGAMENWGLVTYREAKILVKPGSTSETTRRGIARTVCHELAHQWFGNLVTMEFWTQLWLNEGFARFMEFVAVDRLYPDWNIWTEFVQQVYGLALSLDAMTNSHAVEVEVKHPEEIHEIFDAISYAKGASIIRMIASLIGMEAFFEGVCRYLNRHKYGNAVTNDIWGALQEVSGVPVVDFMAPWTLEMGFPIVILSDDGNIRVERYLVDPSNQVQQTKWPIPVTALVEGDPNVHGPWILQGPTGDDTATLQTKIAEWSSAGKWFKLNMGQTGFFRVAYGKDQWARLSRAIKPDGTLSTVDRLGLLSDSFAAGKSGYSPIQDALAFVAGFGEHETADYGVWQELAENIASLATLFRSAPFFPKLQAFIKMLFARQMKILGWEAAENESPRVGTLRGTVIDMMGIAGDEKVLRQAFEKFMAHKQDPSGSPIPGDLRSVIFHCALRHDEGTVYKALKEMYESGGLLPEEERDCLIAMGRVKDSSLHSEMLSYVLFSGKVRLQDMAFPLSSLSSSSDAGGLAAWTFFKENYERIEGQFRGGPMWGAVCALTCRGLKTEEGAQDVEAFFQEKSHSIGSAQRRLRQSLEVIRTNISRRERDFASVEQFLNDY